VLGSFRLPTAEVFAMPPRLRIAAPLALALGFAVLPGPAAAQQDPPVSRIAFGSCADEEKPQPLWDAVLAYRPDLFVFTGDNVYGDVHRGRDVAEGEVLAELREAYAEARSVAGFMLLRRTVPVLATWDDHDYGLNDGGGDFPLKRESQRLFADFWDLPAADPRRTREGLFHAEVLGPPGKRVQVILLDTRSFRSPLKPTDAPGAPGKERYLPDPDPAKTMLGEAQWRWLAERLREPAEIRVVVSSIQVLAEGHGWERWGNLPAERQRLFDLVRDAGARRGVRFGRPPRRRDLSRGAEPAVSHPRADGERHQPIPCRGGRGRAQPHRPRLRSAQLRNDRHRLVGRRTAAGHPRRCRPATARGGNPDLGPAAPVRRAPRWRRRCFRRGSINLQTDSDCSRHPQLLDAFQQSLSAG